VNGNHENVIPASKVQAPQLLRKDFVSLTQHLGNRAEVIHKLVKIALSFSNDVDLS